MSEAEGIKSWWATFPGVLTAIAGVITATGGFLLALNQTGLLGSKSSEAKSVTVAPESGISTVATASGTTPSAASDARAVVAENSHSPAAGAHQASNVVKLGKLTYTLLSAHAEPLNSEKWVLKLSIRLMNDAGSLVLLWDEGFRLKMDGVPRAPISNLYKAVNSRSAEEGEVVFQVPYAARNLELVIGEKEEYSSLFIAFSVPSAAEKDQLLAENVVHNFTFASPGLRSKIQHLALPSQ
ncbi:MAG: hypothetical protein ABL885_09740 [Methylophilaceae bacterium]